MNSISDLSSDTVKILILEVPYNYVWFVFGYVFFLIIGQVILLIRCCNVFY